MKTSDQIISETATSCAAALVGACAREHIDPPSYWLLPGDEDALDADLGRRSTREERIDCEKQIRTELARLLAMPTRV